MKIPCLHRPQQPTYSQLGRDPPRAYLSNGTNVAASSCILQRETVLGEQTSAPMRLDSGSKSMPSSHQAQARHMAKDALGCLWLCGHCCLAGGLRTLKPTPSVFSFGEKANWA